MRASDLPSVNRWIPNALQLQRQVARAIGSVETQVARVGAEGAEETRANLEAFLQAAVDKVASLAAPEEEPDPEE